ncbi:MAG: LysR family transcriptional regulator [Pseudomonadales bacterium]|nr:LysR family transcriptional regulator [Pseudomonadales bacterium]
MKFLELRHLRTLLALRETGSLVEAADKLFLTQSALSHQIKDLEEKLGCNLFLRKSRPVQFTAVGQSLLMLAERILPQISATELEIKQLEGGEIGRLHMAIECHSCFDWLLPAIDEYREQWPDVELDISSGFNFAPLPAVARGELDLAVTADPLPGLDLSYQALFSYESKLVIPAKHALAEKIYIKPQDLKNEVLITYPVDRSRLDIFSQFLTPAGIEPKNIRAADLTAMMIQLVASGRGVTCLPNWALKDYVNNPFVVQRPLGSNGIWPVLYAATRKSDRDVAYMSAFISCAIRTCFSTLVGIVAVADE